MSYKLYKLKQYLKSKKKNKKFVVLSVIGLLCLLTGISYAVFIVSTSGYRLSEMFITKLIYGIEISEVDGNIATIEEKEVTIPANETVVLNIKVSSLNKVNSKYVVAYNTSESVKVYYSNKTENNPEGTLVVDANKEVRIVVENTGSSESVVTFNVYGGYSYNDYSKIAIENNYKKITEEFDESTLAVGDVNIVLKVSGEESETLPGKDDGYIVESISCTNGASGEWDTEKWKLVVDVVKSPTTCTINFVEDTNGCERGTLCSQILADNPNVEVRGENNHPFSTVMTASNNGNTIYKEDFIQDNESYTTYYFAGAVTNNYVKFGQNSSGQDLYWRIVRINEDKSVRLLYAGTSATSTNAFISTSAMFNYMNERAESYYAGYKYSSSQQHGLGTDSTIKTIIDNWYKSNILSYDKYISKTAVYCNDRSTTIGGVWNVRPSYTFYYDAYYRLSWDVKNYNPTFKCTNSNDKYTASTTTGNGVLEYPIALITADEVSYAGGMWMIRNNSYYLSENATTGANYWWTMTPERWNYDAVDGNHGISNIEVGLTSSSYIGGMASHSVQFGNAVRPVLSLKSCVTWSKGNGTANSPYEVTVSDYCSLLEN